MKIQLTVLFIKIIKIFRLKILMESYYNFFLVFYLLIRLAPHNQIPSNRIADSYMSIRIKRPDDPNSYYFFSYVSGDKVFMVDRYCKYFLLHFNNFIFF